MNELSKVRVSISLAFFSGKKKSGPYLISTAPEQCRHVSVSPPTAPASSPLTAPLFVSLDFAPVLLTPVRILVAVAAAPNAAPCDTDEHLHDCLLMALNVIVSFCGRSEDESGGGCCAWKFGSLGECL